VAQNSEDSVTADSSKRKRQAGTHRLQQHYLAVPHTKPKYMSNTNPNQLTNTSPTAMNLWATAVC